MKEIAKAALALALLALSVSQALAGTVKKIDFKNTTPGTESNVLSSLVGNWHTDRDGERGVYAVDGRKWEQGLLAPGAKEKAKALYGEKSAGFLGGLEAYRYFPLAVCKDIRSFQNGSVEVSFKNISGRIDQAAGIAFDIKPNGDYLVLRANAVENNLVLFSMEQGRRSSVQWVRNVPVLSNQWQALKVVINGKSIEGYLNNKKVLSFTWKENIDGKIGLWSKADSYVFFDKLTVESR
jgi:hypothetical protein